jgi:2-C-methyl-D-erythritol 4-phosphate cytidylyltransferase
MSALIDSASAETHIALQRPCVALVPAAGSGTRFSASDLKQYCMLLGQPMIAHAVLVLLQHAQIQQVYVAVAKHDQHVFKVFQEHPKLTILHCGGPTRQETVVNALSTMREENPWVLVHDAARPGLTTDLIDRLLSSCLAHPVGGLLALPVTDTLKRALPPAEVEFSCALPVAVQTLDRQGLWSAQTPQMFKRIDLIKALISAQHHGLTVTDESSAMQAMGLYGCLVAGSMRNWKISYASDLTMVEALIKAGIP